jgi:hypothetical protein
MTPAVFRTRRVLLGRMIRLRRGAPQGDSESMKIAVFCGSNIGVSEVYRDGAAALGRALAEQNIDCVICNGRKSSWANFDRTRGHGCDQELQGAHI